MEREVARRMLENELARVDTAAAYEKAVLGEGHDELFDELTSVDQHQADMASDTYEREQALTVLEVEDERRRDIEHALGKLASGSFGTCEVCGAVIPDWRLEAVPETRFCEPHRRDAELHRLGMRVGPIAAAVPEVAEPGWRELDLLPDDDEESERRSPLSAEEAAMHVEPAGDVDR